MRRLIYDVAVSVDGLISGPNDDASRFLFEGDHVDAYLARLAAYDTVVMGRNTYTAGYAYGMTPGDKAPPYAHMAHHVLSRTLDLPASSEVRVVRDGWLEAIDALKAGAGGDIYLCGGGALAGMLLNAGRIDRVILKLNPIVVGQGVRLFGDDAAARLKLISATSHASGVATLEYSVDA